MSLTSYQAAPPRVSNMSIQGTKANPKNDCRCTIACKEALAATNCVGKIYAARFERGKQTFQRSSVVERSAVNRLVVGSNPTAGANALNMMITEHPQGGWSVYALRNPDGKLYIGQTRNLSHRLHQHNDPAHTLTRTTKRFRGPWELVHSEIFPSRSAALVREKALKSGQGRAWLKARSGCNPAAAGS